jgi:hypothetical protein
VMCAKAPYTGDPARDAHSSHSFRADPDYAGGTQAARVIVGPLWGGPPGPRGTSWSRPRVAHPNFAKSASDHPAGSAMMV